MRSGKALPRVDVGDVGSSMKTRGSCGGRFRTNGVTKTKDGLWQTFDVKAVSSIRGFCTPAGHSKLAVSVQVLIDYLFVTAVAAVPRVCRDSYKDRGKSHSGLNSNVSSTAPR